MSLISSSLRSVMSSRQRGGDVSPFSRRAKRRRRCGKLCAVGLALPAAGSCSPYEAVLGEAFASLHAHVRRAHLPPLRAEGTIDVEHGPGWLARPMIWLMKLPAAGLRQPVRLDVAEDGSELVWTRRIGGSILRTRQRASGSRLVERSGLGRVSFDLAVEDGALAVSAVIDPCRRPARAIVARVRAWGPWSPPRRKDGVSW